MSLSNRELITTDNCQTENNTAEQRHIRGGHIMVINMLLDAIGINVFVKC